MQPRNSPSFRHKQHKQTNKRNETKTKSKRWKQIYKTHARKHAGFTKKTFTYNSNAHEATQQQLGLIIVAWVSRVALIIVSRKPTTTTTCADSPQTSKSSTSDQTTIRRRRRKRRATANTTTTTTAAPTPENPERRKASKEAKEARQKQARKGHRHTAPSFEWGLWPPHGNGNGHGLCMGSLTTPPTRRSSLARTAGLLFFLFSYFWGWKYFQNG
jgi:hypothetical protein